MLPALDLLRRSGSDSVVLGLSGGKDSLAILDLSSQVFKRIVAFFMYIAPGLRCIERHIEAAVARYDGRRYGDHECRVELIKLPPHWCVSQYMMEGLARWDHVEQYQKHLVKLRLKDIEGYVKQKVDIEWVVYGMRIDESLSRRGWIKPIQGFDAKFKRLFPLWNWKATEVKAYLTAKRIPVPNQWDQVTLDSKSAAWLRDNHPDDYQRFLRVYPHAEALAMHWDIHGSKEEEARRNRRRKKTAPASLATTEGRAPGNGDPQCQVTVPSRSAFGPRSTETDRS